MPAMHARTLVDRPLTVLGVTLRILQCDGSIVISRFVLQKMQRCHIGARSPNVSVSCGRGVKTRYRTCNRSRFGGKKCSSLRGALTEQEPCNVHNCSGNEASEEKQPKVHLGLTLMESIIVSAGGPVLLILITMAVILFKKHTMNDNPLQTLSFPPRIPQGERPTGRQELTHLPYENIDHLGRPAANRLLQLFYLPRYENEEVDNETRDVMIRPGYDKLAPGTREKRRQNGGTRRLPCGMVDKHGQSVYDSLIREIDRSRTAELSDSDSENERNIHTILEVPSCDERSPTCSIDRRRNGTGNSKQLLSKDSDDEISLEDIELGCIGNDWKTDARRNKAEKCNH
ncbi:hypothetical protein OS493_018639 [Desmophyllum pertusum]|uniref:Uncharacterized protein n=1 Tax=Desmophyllum pertusum TaxID=174260 RepID=A0A9W9ZNR4_9CNID|nr:hypothetical protein OS493_018639 [Desmophyllum pertusum]